MRFSKFLALILVLVMAMAMTTAAFADEDMEDENGKIGEFESPDTPDSKEKTLLLVKNLVGYNVDEAEVGAPNIKYTYTIEGAEVTDDTTVTDSDDADIHASETSVTVQVKSGVGSPVIADEGVIEWTNADKLRTATDGEDNIKKISISFAGINFGGAGVYRYKITENITAEAYAAAGVTEAQVSGADENVHERFIDVYVRYAENANPDEPGPDNWDIYGYTCFIVNDSIDAAEEDLAGKTSGFTSCVRETKGSASYTADSYYTFNVTIGKIVEGDSYAESKNKFPFTVAFDSSVSEPVDLIGFVSDEDAQKVDGTIDPDAADLNSLTYSVSILSGAKVKIIGIPCGTTVIVNETNNVTGAIYSVTSDLLVNDTKNEDASTVDGSLAERQDSTPVTIATEADENDDNVYEVVITNTLLTISPTGVIVRYAPYILVLFGGILILLLGLKLMNRSKKNDEA